VLSSIESQQILPLNEEGSHAAGSRAMFLAALHESRHDERTAVALIG